jgi:competence protein ComGC
MAKNPYIINQNHILVSHYWIDFNKFYTKTFGIVHILIVYLLIMLLSVIFIFQLKINPKN